MSLSLAAPRSPVAGPSDTVRGIMLLTLCYIVMSLGDVSVKFVLPAIGVSGAMIARGTFGAGAVALIAVRGGGGGLRRLLPVRWGPVLLRAALQAISGLCWFAAWERMALADSYAVGFTTPLLAALGAVLFLGERKDPHRIGAMLLGFIGVLLMVRPGSGLWSPALAILMVGVGCSAIARVMTRNLGATETPECLSFSLLLAHLPAGLALLFFVPLPHVTLALVPALLALGVTTGLSQTMFARAYSMAPVSALAPFDYSSMLWGVSFGWIFFGEVPHLDAIQGAVVIAIAGLYSLRVEQRRARAAA